ncbi:MAG: hypothetical protein Q3M24_01325 [Candidatus Electrothrix aestuarii]|uniref:Transposase n=1 Tax=Candidatus Electrothrix aestuarii TaxID=3062594 RepID=A0AAU8LWE4_9BACT
MKNPLDTAFDEGRAEGKEEGRIEEKRQVVINGLQQGLSIQMIATLTGLSEEEIVKIVWEISEEDTARPLSKLVNWDQTTFTH